MKALKLGAPLLICFLIVTSGQSKPKKPDVPAVFQNARYVYVEAVDGDILKPGLYPEDRQAITDVQDSIRAWNRYAIALNRGEADLVIVVRKGRLAGAQLHGGSRAERGPSRGRLRIRIRAAGRSSRAAAARSWAQPGKWALMWIFCAFTFRTTAS
jgi:hypothetical protein